jgi:nucleotide-binding universal stress UspA family protein
MWVDPLTSHVVILPGGLHHIPGGLNVPAQRRWAAEDARPDPLPEEPGTAERVIGGLTAFSIRCSTYQHTMLNLFAVSASRKRLSRPPRRGSAVRQLIARFIRQANGGNDDKILCAVDGQPASSKAAAAAFELAKGHSSSLILCMVNPILSRLRTHHGLWPDEHIERILNEAARRAAWFGALRVTCAARRGIDVAEEIVACAEERNAAYIVLGASGRSPLMSLLSGSVWPAVVGKANCLVLVVGPTWRRREGRLNKGLPAQALPSEVCLAVT